MDGLFVGLMSALWLGLLTSISPCPLATNIAAISFIGRDLRSKGGVLLAGLLYTAGRMLAYAVLGLMIVGGLLSVPSLSMWLQKNMNQLLGPVLILTGMFLIELLRFRLPGGGAGQRIQRIAESWGYWGAALLGIVFALSFCPVSAALFFGSLIPLSVRSGAGLAMPVVYGIGTGLPVVVFAFLIALGAGSLGRVFEHMGRIEFWARRATGAVFIVVGIYLSLTYIFHLL